MTDLITLYNSNILAASLLGLMVIDWITGMLASLQQGKLSSSDGWKGISKKFSIMLMCAASLFLENLMRAQFQQSWPIAGMVTGAYIFNEFISIMENLRRSNIKTPEFMDKILKDASEKYINDALASIASMLSKAATAQPDKTPAPAPVITTAVTTVVTAPATSAPTSETTEETHHS